MSRESSGGSRTHSVSTNKLQEEEEKKTYSLLFLGQKEAKIHFTTLPLADLSDLSSTLTLTKLHTRKIGSKEDRTTHTYIQTDR